MMRTVAIESVSKTFRQGGLFFKRARAETRALKNVSMEVSAREVFGLLGPNGSGKSTTLKLVSTLLLPDLGRILVGGYDTRTHGNAVRERVSLSLASERSFYPRLTVRENLEFFAALEDVPRRKSRARVASILQQVRLDHVAEKQAMKLSSGMYQRMGIARALLKKPAVLLLDEPSRSLDAAATSELWDLARELAEKNITILMATHNFAEAAAVCDRAAILNNGELLDIISMRGLVERELRDLYFETIGDRRVVREEVPA